MSDHGSVTNMAHESSENEEHVIHTEATGWVLDGVLSGAIGAGVVAIFFLVVDLVDGRPLWTPAALGSALFLREPLSPSAGPPLVLVLAYTAVHGLVFVAGGVLSSFAVLGHRERLGPLAGLAIAVALFGVFETVFLMFNAWMDAGLISELGGFQIAAANALAAGTMAALVLKGPMRRT